jgi:ubiquinone/menaquinone biosynthesis C-methylase UbiE
MLWQDRPSWAMMVMLIEATNMGHGPSEMTFPDHFSDHADRYEAYRPTYPDALFAYLNSLVPAHDLALDCATGNGQAAIKLTPYFRSIVALDASPRQLALARSHEQITYVVALADRTPLPDRSVDLVTVATAFHWLDFSRFYAEVRRVAKAGGILAAWSYKRPNVTSDVDVFLERLDTEVLRDFWLPETTLAREGYRTVPFPFDEIDAPPFRMTREWNLDHLMGFLGTWSASLRYRTQTGRDPIGEIRDDLTKAWGDPDQDRQIAWDLFMRVGMITGRGQ